MNHDIDTAQLTELSTTELSTTTGGAAGGVFNAPASFSGPFANFVCRQRTQGTEDKLECKWQNLAGQNISPVYKFKSTDAVTW